MARERRRLLISQERLQAAARDADGRPLLPLTVEESHYLTRVLRLRQGQELAIVNGSGQLWGACLAPGDGRQRQLQLLQPLQAPEAAAAPAAIAIQLTIALPKRDADLLLRMACELGVDRVQPLIADHSVLAEPSNRQRWTTILREASEQCERLWLPELAEPVPSSLWFGAPPQGLGLLATTRNGPLAGVLERLPPQAPGPLTLQLAIGPEGGWSEREEELAEAAGWQAVALTGTILRTATAAVAGLALLSHWRDQISGFDRRR